MPVKFSKTSIFICLISILFRIEISLAAQESSEASPEPEPITTTDPNIPVGELELLLKPLTKSQLVIEAGAWQVLLQEKAQDIAKAEVAVKRQNREIEKAQEIQKKAQETKEKLEEVNEKTEEMQQTGDAEAAQEASEAAQEAQEAMQEVQQVAQEAIDAAERTEEIHKKLSEKTKQGLKDTAVAADQAVDSIEEVQQAVQEGTAAIDEGKGAVRAAAERAQQATAAATSATDKVSDKAADVAVQVTADSAQVNPEQTKVIEGTIETAAQAETAKKDEKVDLLENVTELREERTVLLDRFHAALDALENKTHENDSDTVALLQDYRLYATAVSGIDVDVEDTVSAWIAIKGWLLSKEGGLRWVKNIATFIGILVVAWFISRLLSSGIRRTLKGFSGTSRLLGNFLVRSVRWVVMAIGIIMALAALEVSIGPLLAVVGAAGFVIAFALQDSLSNFASGIMILFFKPFDEGDVIEAGGVSGKVVSMNLVSTMIKTFDNKNMLVPNNNIWNNVITNATGVTERRVDMEFGIGYDDDIDQAHKILEEIIGSHSKVLNEPKPAIRMHALADSSVNFIVRPWAKTEDYWDVYWDVTKEVKKRFDAAGIGIPFPQRDVHLYIKNSESEAKITQLAAQNPTPVSTEQPER